MMSLVFMPLLLLANTVTADMLEFDSMDGLDGTQCNQAVEVPEAPVRCKT